MKGARKELESLGLGARKRGEPCEKVCSQVIVLVEGAQWKKLSGCEFEILISGQGSVK